MSVKVVIAESGETIVGKFAIQEGAQVYLFSGIMSDKKGGFRGCGKKRTFPTSAVSVTADDPAVEVRRR